MSAATSNLARMAMETSLEQPAPVRQVANAVVGIATLPLATNVQFMTILPTAMPLVGRG